VGCLLLTQSGHWPVRSWRKADKLARAAIVSFDRQIGRRLFTPMLLLDESKLQRRSLARNELLFRQGDKVQAIYFIEEGRLRLDRRTFDGRSLVIGTNSAGEFLVEAALFAEIFHCDAVARLCSRKHSSQRCRS